jgi:hypothetical protein
MTGFRPARARRDHPRPSRARRKRPAPNRSTSLNQPDDFAAGTANPALTGRVERAATAYEP